MKPEIKVSVPGPNASKIVERDHRALITTTKTSPVVAKRAKGVWVEDVDGNRFMDFTSGIGVVNVGFSNPRVTKAIQEQAAELVHYAGTDFYYDKQVSLAERLNEITPGDYPKKVFFTNSGAESNEAAIKLCKYQEDRTQFIAFYGAFHGRTAGALSFTASKPVHKRGFFPLMPGVTHVPFPNPYRNIWGVDGYENPDELADKAIDFIENTVFAHTLPPDNVAGVWIEPVQGEGGYVVPPKSFYPKLKKLCEKHGILMAADEVQTGFGRTGTMFGMEHYGVEPDMMMLAKGIANGMPMGALVARADLDYDVSGAHSNTYGGNLLCSASALATIDALLVDGILENGKKMGVHLEKRLKELQAKHDCIGDVRGLGLMQATEFVKDRATKAPDYKKAGRVTEEAWKRGLVLLPCGKNGLRYIPPLSITADEIDAGIEVLDAALKAA